MKYLILIAGLASFAAQAQNYPYPNPVYQPTQPVQQPPTVFNPNTGTIYSPGSGLPPIQNPGTFNPNPR